MTENVTSPLKSQWIIRPTNDTAIVFIHGILSDSDSCWRNDNVYWPKMVADDHQVKGVGVYVFSYRADAFSKNYSLGDAVEALNALLNLDGLLKLQRLVFVCHSMGGIVARQFIVTRESALIEKGINLGLFLVASPSLGSDYANLVIALAKALGNTQAEALRFADNNNWLNDLDRNFLNLKEREKLSVRGQEIIEDEFVVLSSVFSKQVVRAFSGARYFGQALKVPYSNHFTIAKPAAPDALQHRLLVQFIVNFLQPNETNGNNHERFSHGLSQSRETTSFAGTSSAPGPISGAPVGEGLVALQSLTQDPRIKAIALHFSLDFDKASMQIKEVIGYKNLHDQLHELQTKVLDPLKRSAPAFPGDEDAKAELNEYRIDFEDVNLKLKEIATQFTRADTSWISSLEASLKDFQLSLERNDPMLLREVIKRIDRVLTLHPPRINTRLNAAARALELSALVKALSEVRDDAAKLSKPGSERVRRLSAGVDVLDRMDKNLGTLVARHDYWQDFDANLSAMEKNQTLEDLLGWWPDVRQMIERVAESYGPEPWMASFLQDCGVLQKHIQEGELAQISRSFRQVQRQVSKRFYNTDTELKNQCDELRTVGESLANLEVDQ